MAENTKEHDRVRMGPEVNNREGDNVEAKRQAGSVLSSNGVFAKTLKDGKIEVVPTSEVYEKEPDERVDGIDVTAADRSAPLLTGVGGKVLGASVADQAQREFNTSERGDSASKHHAQGAAGSISRDEVPEVDREEGAYEDEAEQRKAHREGRAEGAEDGQEGTQEADGGFDPGDPEATTLTDLPGALEAASDEDVKKAQKADSRKGAKEHYEERLSSE